MEALYQAIKHCGNQARLADQIGTRQQNISLWLKRGEVPAVYVLPICRATQGKVIPNDIRPDLYPSRDWRQE